MSMPGSAACERNRDPILAVLQKRFSDRRRVLEIGSGTGEHAVHFAAAMPNLVWQCSDHRDYLSGIRERLEDASLANTPAPFELQAVADPVPHFAPPPSLPTGIDGVAIGYDAVFSANTLHIMSWPQVEAFFAALPTVLADAAVLVVYGPFHYDGRATSDSNRAFDEFLQARDPQSGLRDAAAVNRLAQSIGLKLIADVEMPANNRCLIWQRGIKTQA